MIKKSLIITALLLLSFSSLALDIGGAKSSGQIGEKPNGYLGLVAGQASPEVKALVADINKKRKAAYQALAKKQKLTLAQVEKLSGERNFKKTKAGNYIFKGGKWVKK